MNRQAPAGINPHTVAALERLGHILTTAVLSLKRRVIRGEIEASLKAAGRVPRLPVEIKSQFGEDMWLWDLFDGKLDGTFVEVGAFDGYDLSVSYLFESIGWTGVLVEPGPEQFRACAARRTGSRVVHAALSREGCHGTASFTVAPSDGTLSYLTADREHQQQVHRLERGAQRRVDVPLMSMNDVLGENPGPIDFVVIDVEGGEADLLDGFALERYRPRIVMIEEGVGHSVSPFQNRMAAAGYAPAAFVAINRVFVRSDEKELLARAASLGAL